ncbi:Cys-tRNA(Pro) deacylase [Paenisporosarcina quisquiliarum]|uniref:Cys-tRNA(Pro)/Cys-tRNA(Cys) deacylase n=1 Tax=Paenisporosarcina quisquiliarum TaxID=365346 RepID=A0A9X3RDZ8_9BACL|nr:Cys-tRNA(Pro) deacylase [Paenisporosarcina quisquiliarum]MCZ8538081.1 Cys-tRNA(Pro) deacylase [Paenisporosarcina quisquiliarum]
MVKSSKPTKTNAVRLLDQQKISYDLFEYEVADGQIDGVSVAHKIEQPVEKVFKTLVATAGLGKVFVFLVPVAQELNLKAAAKAAGEKKVEMLPVKDLLGLTGYIRGGCSPLGMKKLFPTFIDESARELDKMIVSAGKIGTQIHLKPSDLVSCTKGIFVSLTKAE